jgi:hypothetical protein
MTEAPPLITLMAPAALRRGGTRKQEEAVQ